MWPSGVAGGADLVLDLLAGVTVDVLPVLEGLLEHLTRDAAEQVADHVVDELGALSVVPDVADECAGLTEVIVLRVQLVGERTIGPSASQLSSTGPVRSEYGRPAVFGA